MQAPVILSIDQGTTNSKAMLVRADGSILLSRSRPMRVHHPRPGWAEQSAAEIWDVVAALIDELIAAVPDATVAAIAIANQRETIVLWDAATGQPVAPAVTWQCRRSTERCAALAAAGHGETVAARSGLALDPMFSAGKLAWLLDSVPDARARAVRGELRCGTVDSWLLSKLTGGAVHATEHGNASRTQLLNLDTGTWDAELARLFDVPMAMLPEVMASDACFGTVAAGVTALPAGTPIHAMMGDSHAALFAHGITAPGRVKATIGTGSSLMTATKRRVRSTHGLSSTIAWSRGGTIQHGLEGNITVSGHAAAFTTSLLGLANEDELTRLAESVDGSGGVVFVPALAGLGAPHWAAEARGTITGMTLATTPAHIARATIEAIALQIGDVLAAMEADLSLRFSALSVDGGAARSDLLVWCLADLTERLVLRPHIAEASALGAARMAAEALDLPAWADTAPPDRFAPTLPADRRAAIVAGWRRAVAGIVAPPGMGTEPETGAG